MSGPAQYPELLRAALHEAIVGNGSEVLGDPVVLGGLLADLIPDFPQLTRILLASAEIGTAAMLSDCAEQGMDAGTAIGLAASDLEARTLYPADVCQLISTELAIALAVPGAGDAGLRLARQEVPWPAYPVTQDAALPESPGPPAVTSLAEAAGPVGRLGQLKPDAPGPTTVPRAAAPPRPVRPGDLPAVRAAGPPAQPARPAVDAAASPLPGPSGSTGKPPSADAGQQPVRPRVRALAWKLVTALLAVAAIVTALLIVVSQAPAAPAQCPGTKRCVIGVGQAPRALVVTPDGKTLYVANSGDGTVTPIDIATGTASKPIRVGHDPAALVLTPGGPTLYVANSGDGTVTPISTATGTPRNPIRVGTDPVALAVAPDGTMLYVADRADGTVTPISTVTGTPGTPIRVGGQPGALAVTPDGKTLYVASSGDRIITPINIATRTPGNPIRVGADPRALAATQDGSWLYVASSGDGTVTPISTATGVPGTPIEVGGHPAALAVTPDGKTLYVSSGAGAVWPVGTATGAPGTPIQVGGMAGALAVTPDGKTLYAASRGGTTVAVRPLAGSQNEPAGFQVLSMTFVSDTQGYALGTVSCGSGRCIALRGTQDGGVTWPALTAPVRSVARFGTCQLRGPCVQQVRFANSQDGYAFDPSLFVTTDGGLTWQPGETGVSSLEAANGTVVRVISGAAGCGGQRYLVESAVAGATSWLALQAPPIPMICPPVLYSQGSRLVLVGYGNPAGGTRATAQIDRYDGRTWVTGPDRCGGRDGYASAVALAQPDVLVLLCQHQMPGPGGGFRPAWIRISADGGATFGPDQVVPSAAGRQNGTMVRYQLAAATDGRLLIAETSTQGSRLLLTQNGGLRWSTTLRLPGNGTVILVGYEDPLTGRVAQGDLVWTTYDGGQTWTRDQFSGG